jgi:hypothetical protein
MFKLSFYGEVETLVENNPSGTSRGVSNAAKQMRIKEGCEHLAA